MQSQDQPLIMTSRRLEKTFSKHSIAEMAITCIGCALVAFALAANQEWLDRHFLPAFFVPRQKIIGVELCARIAIGVLGAAIALIARRPIARILTASP